MSASPAVNTFDVVLSRLLSLRSGSELLVICDETVHPFLDRLLESCTRQLVMPSLMYVPKSLQAHAIRSISDLQDDARIVPFILGSAIRSARAIMTILSGDLELS